jgi:ABC-2 type transport system ATP-binding protein
MTVIEVRGLTKRFGSATVVDGLSFAVGPGTVTGFLGPNGAGKTTTLRVLLGLVRPTSGQATIWGKPYRELGEPRRRVGAVLEASGFHPGRTVADQLGVRCAATGAARSRIGAVLAETGLGELAGRRAGRLSLGERQRLGLAGALLGDPELLVLDEPANGLDPEGVRWLRDFLRSFAGSGHTVLVSSHVLAEVAQTVDHVLIISRGKLVRESRLDELTAGMGGAVRVRSPQADRLREALAGDGITVTEASGALFAQGTTSERVGEVAAAAGIVLHELRLEQSSLEEVFLDLTSEKPE